MSKAKDKPNLIDPALEAFTQGLKLVAEHPLFCRLLSSAPEIIRRQGVVYPEKGLAYVFSNGQIHVHPTRRAEPAEWAYAIAHCLLHLAFGHFQPQTHQREWDLACDLAVYRF